jgi:hypothetical protein
MIEIGVEGVVELVVVNNLSSSYLCLFEQNLED